MKAVIIGRGGQVAWELQQTVPENTDVFVLGSSDIDILNFESISKIVIQLKPDVIINASAYTAVDQAETDVEAAYAINETAVKYLAEISKKLKCRLLHISTDFVFDGEKNRAYEVNDLTNPLGVYGSSKLAGEKVIEETFPENSVIIRTAWVYSSHGNNFVKTMLHLMEEKEELNVVSDQIGCPTYARGLAKFLWSLVELESTEPVYHWTDLGVASWYDFAVAIREEGFKQGVLNKKIPINPIKSQQYPTKARRPHISLLDLGKSLDIKNGKYWQTSLADCIRIIRCVR